MPLFRRNPEDAPAIGGPGPEPRTDVVPQRPQTLTLELLDWLIAALEAVLVTPQVRDIADRRAAQALRSALLYADHLYPLTLEAQPADDQDEQVA